MDRAATRRVMTTAVALTAVLLSGCGGPGGTAGDAEDDAVLDAVAESDAPEADATTLYRPLDDAEIDTVSGAQLVMPDDQTVTLTGRGLAAEAAADVVLVPETYRAPEGTVFHVFTFTGGDALGEEPVVRTSDAELVLAGSDLDRGIAVVAAPDDTVYLDLTLDGVTQTLDLTTGERTSVDVAADWYTDEQVVAPEPDVAQTVETDLGTMHWTTTIGTVERTPYDFSWGGWAMEGAGSWLVVPITGTSWERQDEGFWSAPKYDAVAVLTDAEGTEYQPVREDHVGLDGEYTWVFEVPAGGTEYELTVTDRANLNADDASRTAVAESVVTVPLRVASA